MKAIAKELDESLTLEEKALTIASHNAEIAHLEIVAEMLSSNRKFLKTPPSGPLLVGSNNLKEKSSIQHPCSGKHAAILLACELNRWSKENYTTKEHAYHTVYLKELKKHLGENYSPTYTATDGCGLSTLSFSLRELASLYSALVREREKDWVWRAAISCPNLIGGANRLDTYILRMCEGKVFAKEGADGLLGLGIEHPSYPKGLGIVIKLAHGWDMSAMSFVAFYILRSLGFPVDNIYSLEDQEAVVSVQVTPSLKKNITSNFYYEIKNFR